MIDEAESTMAETNNARMTVLVAAVVAVVAGMGGWILRGRDAAAPEPPTESVEAPVETRETIESVASPSTPPPMDAESAAAMSADNAKAVNEIVAAGEKQLRTRYESERVDPSWAAGKQQALERLAVSPLIEQVDAQPLSISAQCRKSVCLIRADFPNRVAADDWFTLYTLNAGPEMTNASSRSIANPDGTVRLEIYGLARP